MSTRKSFKFYCIIILFFLIKNINSWFCTFYISCYPFCKYFFKNNNELEHNTDTSKTKYGPYNVNLGDTLKIHLQFSTLFTSPLVGIEGYLVVDNYKYPTSTPNYWSITGYSSSIFHPTQTPNWGIPNPNSYDYIEINFKIPLSWVNSVNDGKDQVHQFNCNFPPPTLLGIDNVLAINIYDSCLPAWSPEHDIRITYPNGLTGSWYDSNNVIIKNNDVVTNISDTNKYIYYRRNGGYYTEVINYQVYKYGSDYDSNQSEIKISVVGLNCVGNALDLCSQCISGFAWMDDNKTKCVLRTMIPANYYRVDNSDPHKEMYLPCDVSCEGGCVNDDNSVQKPNNRCFGCSANYPYYDEYYSPFKSCYEDCRYSRMGYIVHDNERFLCVQNCGDDLPGNIYLSEDSTTCLEKCPDKRDNNKCVTTCPNYIDYSTQTCTDNCPFEFENTKICNDDCEEPYIFKVTSGNKCLIKCSGSYPFEEYNSSNNKECAANCSNYLLILGERKICYANLGHCPSEYSIMVKRNSKIECTDDCINYDVYPYYHSDLKECVSECSSTLPYILEKRCVAHCPLNYTEKDGKCVSHFDFPLDDKNEFLVCDIKLDDWIPNYLTHNDDAILRLWAKEKTMKCPDYYLQVYSEDSTSWTNQKISSLSLNECIQVIKNKLLINDNEKLIIVKIDNHSPNDSTPQVFYSLYRENGKNLNPNNLELCNQIRTDITYPLINTENYNYDDLKSMKTYGVLYNSSDPFFKDICIPFQDDLGNDVLLNDRRYYYINQTFCEDSLDCVLKKINLDNDNAVCECNIKPKWYDTSVNYGNPIASGNNEPFATEKETQPFNLAVLKCIRKVGTRLETNIAFFTVTITMGWLMLIITMLLIFEISAMNSQMFRIVKTCFVSNPTQPVKGFNGIIRGRTGQEYNIASNVMLNRSIRPPQNSLQQRLKENNNYKVYNYPSLYHSRRSLRENSSDEERKPYLNQGSYLNRAMIYQDMKPEDGNLFKKEKYLNDIADIEQKQYKNKIVHDDNWRQKEFIIPNGSMAIDNRLYNNNGIKYQGFFESGIRYDRNNNKKENNTKNKWYNRSAIWKRIKWWIKNGMGIRPLSKQLNDNESDSEDPFLFSSFDIDNNPYDIAVFEDRRSFFTIFCKVLKEYNLILRAIFKKSPIEISLFNAWWFILELVLLFIFNTFFFFNIMIIGKNLNKKTHEMTTLRAFISTIVTIILIKLCKQYVYYYKYFVTLVHEIKIKTSFTRIWSRLRAKIKLRIVTFTFFVCALIIFAWLYCVSFCMVYRGVQLHWFIGWWISIAFSFGIDLLLTWLYAFFRSLGLEIKSQWLYNCALLIRSTC